MSKSTLSRLNDWLTQRALLKEENLRILWALQSVTYPVTQIALREKCRFYWWQNFYGRLAFLEEEGLIYRYTKPSITRLFRNEPTIFVWYVGITQKGRNFLEELQYE